MSFEKPMTNYKFERIEKKFWLNVEQYQALLPLFDEKLNHDRYGESTICNIYYDTPDYTLIRRSIERPLFKEKLRLRSYGIPEKNDSVFVEIKRKLNGIGYKRRISVPFGEAKKLLRGEPIHCDNPQIEAELLEFIKRYRPLPMVYLTYQRYAMTAKEDPEFRVTINVSNAKHTLIYLPESSSNRLSSGFEQEITVASENTDVESASGATLYAKDSISFAGNGKLTVDGYINNAVATTDHLIVLGGELNLSAVNNGLKGKDSVTVLDGTISIHSGNDGIKSNNDTQADCGNIDIRGGEINIVSLGDGIEAEKDLSVEDGIITITAGDTTASDSRESVPALDNRPENIPNDMNGGIPGGMEGGSMPQGDEMPPEMPPEMPQEMQQPGMRQSGMQQPEMQQGMQRPEMQQQDRGERFDRKNEEQFDLSGASTKGLKSGGELKVSGGIITVNSVDDAIHVNGSITITGGTFRLSTGDDGFHADDTLSVSDGDIIVSASYEGLEGHLIDLSGGNISITASDDGTNANGGSSGMFGRMFGASGTGDSSLPTLKISGGTLYVNADGDGLDSNGDLIIEGGNIIVDGPTNDGNGALDSGSENGGSIVCNGGTILAIGASGMAETFESDSAQCSFIQNFTGTLPAGTEITITDENGKMIFEHKSAKTFNSVVFSSPELQLGNTYTITVGNQTKTIATENISNGRSSGSGMQGDFDRHNRK